MNIEESLKNTEKATERLLADHLFDAVDKTKWVKWLIEEGFSEEEAKSGFKKAAQEYHNTRTEIKNKKYNRKLNGKDVIKGTVKYTTAGILTFVVGPIIYAILVLIIVAILGYVFNF